MQSGYQSLQVERHSLGLCLTLPTTAKQFPALRSADAHPRIDSCAFPVVNHVVLLVSEELFYNTIATCQRPVGPLLSNKCMYMYNDRETFVEIHTQTDKLT